MTSGYARPRIAIIWSTEARLDLRAIDREIALQILYCVDRYLASRSGDVKKLNRRVPASASAAPSTASSLNNLSKTPSRLPLSATAEMLIADLLPTG